jgi:GMP synthase (glutamine-hydrolysing)
MDFGMFDPDRFILDAIEGIKRSVEGRTIVACSGGVDSTVVAVLASRALKDQALAVFVDHGVLRKNEAKGVSELLTQMEVQHRFVNASDEFFTALQGIEKPEEKRKVIGAKFIEVFDRVAKDFGAEYLIQGTIAPDWIESGGSLRDTIKSHHNVGGLPEKMSLKLYEPLRDLYKDEVRKVAVVLGLPTAKRQPFPGPGLAVRVMGEVTREKVAIAREACAIAEEEIERAANTGQMEIPWQYFAILLPQKSVGVHGDVRAYGYTIVIRAVESLDGMTAAYSKIPHNVLERISVRITNTLKDSVTRVVYDISNKPPGTIEWE